MKFPCTIQSTEYTSFVSIKVDQGMQYIIL